MLNWFFPSSLFLSLSLALSLAKTIKPVLMCDSAHTHHTPPHPFCKDTHTQQYTHTHTHPHPHTHTQRRRDSVQTRLVLSFSLSLSLIRAFEFFFLLYFLIRTSAEPKKPWRKKWDRDFWNLPIVPMVFRSVELCYASVYTCVCVLAYAICVYTPVPNKAVLYWPLAYPYTRSVATDV